MERKFHFPKYKKLFTFRALKVFSWNIRSFKVSVSWNMRKFFQGFRFLNHKKFSRGGFFYFSSLGWIVQGSISGNLRKAFIWVNTRKAMFRENVIFLILELESSISGNIRNFLRSEFFFSFFWGGALTGMCEVALKYNTNSSSDETSLGVTTIARSISHRYRNMEVIVSGLLPRDIHWSKQGVKINNANAYLRDYYKKSNKKTFMRQEPDWTLPDNSLNIWNYIIKFTFTWLKTETPNSQTLKHCRSYYHQSS